VLETVAGGQGGTRINAYVNRISIYLDNFAIISIATTRDVDLRRRFVSIFQNGADLMFSPTNAAELLGPQSPTTILPIRNFLDAIGPHWFPLETVKLLDVMKAEDEGESAGKACLSEWFLNQYFAAGNIWRYGEQRSGLVEPDFFRLSLVLDWLPGQRERMRVLGADFESSLRTQIMRMRKLYERDKRGFQRLFPRLKWQDNKPATFVYYSLLWQLVMEARAFQIKQGDGHDFFHSVMASAYSQFAALDKHWKRRIEMLPKPNRLATIYYEPQLNDLATAVEAIL